MSTALYGRGAYGFDTYGRFWISDISLDGESVPFDAVIADLTIRHGRGGIHEDADASSAQLTLLGLGRPFTTEFRVGAALTIHANSEPRFTGTVTDAGFDAGELTLVGVGMLATYAPRLLPVDWTAPAETWSARVARLFSLAGLSGVLVLEPDPDYNPQLAAVVAGDGAPELGAAVTFANEAVGALFCDLPDGRLLVQAIGGRVSDPVVPFDPDDVLWAPAWGQALDVRNIVTVEYGVDLSTTVTDTSSVALYGPKPETIATGLALLADASARASQRLARVAHPRWNMPACPLLVPYALELGGQVQITELPADAPAAEWAPVVEGWTDQIIGNEWTMLVALSDPLFSGLVLAWSAVPTTVKWNTADPGCSWLEATSIGALT